MVSLALILTNVLLERTTVTRMLTVTTMTVDSLANALQDFSVTVKTAPTAMNALRELTIVTPTQAVLTSKVIFTIFV